MKRTVFALSIIFLAATAARSADIFDKKSSFSFREMMKSFAAFFTAPAPKKLSPAGLPPSLPPADALAYLTAEKPALLDIRTPDEYAQGSLKDAVLLDFYAPDFSEKLGRLDKAAKYLIYCRSGRRSAKALETMAQLGFTEAHDIKGGITAWAAAGYPVSTSGQK
ncbi:MAG TPA: rhodanese-like domain-containing protein [Elusimicrobiales bacterium]|nr:rhodanese-like domain-containing protein [Elusimicrobiales bacterium]